MRPAVGAMAGYNVVNVIVVFSNGGIIASGLSATCEQSRDRAHLRRDGDLPQIRIQASMMVRSRAKGLLSGEMHTPDPISKPR